MFCPKCGKDSAPGARFCESCGTALSGRGSDQEQPMFGSQPPYGQQQYGMMQMKNAGIAAVLAFLLAGLGHIYLGQIGKGIMLLVMYIVLWVVGGIVAVFTLGLGFLIPFVFLIWQVYDAYRSANEYNTALQQTGRPPW